MARLVLAIRVSRPYLESAFLDFAAQSERSGGVAHGGEAQVHPIPGDENREPGHIEAALRLWELSRLQAHDIGLVLLEDLGQPGHETQLVTAADGDPVGDAARRTRARI